MIISYTESSEMHCNESSSFEMKPYQYRTAGEIIVRFKYMIVFDIFSVKGTRLLKTKKTHDIIVLI